MVINYGTIKKADGGTIDINYITGGEIEIKEWDCEHTKTQAEIAIEKEYIEELIEILQSI